MTRRLAYPILMLALLVVASPTGPAAEDGTWPDYTKDLTVWPNVKSKANSDPWIVKHHDIIRRLEPRVLVLNFANDFDIPKMEAKTNRLIKALAEGSRYHGYKDPEAPAVLNYRIFKYVDLKDTVPPKGREHKNGKRFPKLPGWSGKGQNCDYGRFYTDEFTALYEVKDPRNPEKNLSLAEMIDLGMVHELWFWCIHDEEGAPLETIEVKQYYDEKLRPRKGVHGPAGNGHSFTQPWTGRSFRITFFNVHRGIGCGMENFSHAQEGMAHYNFCPYYRKYFYEYGEFDLDKKYGLPFNSFYAAPYENGFKVRYTSPTSFVYHQDGDEVALTDYQGVAGNVHFPPGAKCDYDMKSNIEVMSTIEHYRLRDGKDGKDIVEKWKMERFYRYNDFAPDGMGPWLVYWRQNMPGLDNPCVDDKGKPMKNWWIFLFY